MKSPFLRVKSPFLRVKSHKIPIETRPSRCFTGRRSRTRTSPRWNAAGQHGAWQRCCWRAAICCQVRSMAGWDHQPLYNHQPWRFILYHGYTVVYIYIYIMYILYVYRYIGYTFYVYRYIEWTINYNHL